MIKSAQHSSAYKEGSIEHKDLDIATNAERNQFMLVELPLENVHDLYHILLRLSYPSCLSSFSSLQRRVKHGNLQTILPALRIAILMTAI